MHALPFVMQAYLSLDPSEVHVLKTLLNVKIR